MERRVSIGIFRPKSVDHHQTWSQMLRWEETETDLFIWIPTEISESLAKWKAPSETDTEWMCPVTFTYCNIRHDGWCNKVSFLKTLYFHVATIQLNLENGSRIHFFDEKSVFKTLPALVSVVFKMFKCYGTTRIKLALTKFFLKRGWNRKSGHFYQSHTIKHKLLMYHCGIPR